MIFVRKEENRLSLARWDVDCLLRTFALYGSSELRLSILAKITKSCIGKKVAEGWSGRRESRRFNLHAVWSSRDWRPPALTYAMIWFGL